ncbi:RNA polymerase sigma-70 factor (ECF subfamily) [Arthrobacter sp. 1088]|uniref:RNA polymerase sigma factor n=1 Tax=Arthrobacter sp. 1088 TaxID=2817768 RepID=UPI0028595A4F|nr:RNA polymerase sigma factor [Arthrobacter sp. 1088]MDR6685342.1 RNA polymerase sigma-70 factor (ECF subfamily) [Arthrobacter sp. 1088]
MGNVEADEEALWARSLEGDGQAFGALYDKHSDRVLQHAYRLIGDHHDAEDVMAAAFLELWRLKSKVRIVEGTIAPWLLVTTTNLARNSTRATRRYRRLLESLPRTPSTALAPDPHTVLDPLATLDPKLEGALRVLSLGDLRLVSLVVFEGYTIAAAANLLDLKPGAAKTRLHRARERMKAVLMDSTALQTKAEQTNGPVLLEGKRS